MSDQIQCPSCGSDIAITEALSKQLQVDVEKRYKQQMAILHEKMAKEKSEIEKKEVALKQQRERIEEEIKKKSEAQREVIKKEMWEKAKKAANDKSDLELKDLKEQLEEKKKVQEEFEKKELEMRRERREIEEAQRKMKLEMERAMDEERKTISEKIEKQIQGEMRLKMMEKEKQLADTQKALEEAKRKAGQGSQQNQGEVLELDLESTLNEVFKFDDVVPVGKGVSGADIVQTVKTNTGKPCGVILWEIKQTKNWTEKWVMKFKDDLRAAKANIPVLVTTSLPKNIEGFGFYQGIWVCLPVYAVQLAVALRKNLMDVAFEKAASAGKGGKQELLYNYVASYEFRQRVEAIVEVYQEMQIQINKERAAYERLWKSREGQLQRLFINTAGMYGEIQGRVGTSLSQIKGLELESGNEEDDMKLF